MSWLDPEITITNHRLLRFFGFNPKSPKARISQPLSYWARCWWWKVTKQ